MLDLFTKLDEVQVEVDRITARIHSELGLAALRLAIDEVKRMLADHHDRLVKPGEAAILSGYSKRHLRRLVAEGKLTDHGRHRAPRYRVSELPIKPGRRSGPGTAPGAAPQQDNSVASAAAQPQTLTLHSAEPLKAPTVLQPVRTGPTRCGRDASIECRAREMARRHGQSRVA